MAKDTHSDDDHEAAAEESMVDVEVSPSAEDEAIADVADTPAFRPGYPPNDADVRSPEDTQRAERRG